MSATATPTKVTKKELEAQIAELQAENERLGALVTEGYLVQTEALHVLDEGRIAMQNAAASVTEAHERLTHLEIDAELSEIIEDELSQDVEDVFNRLKFAVLTLTTIVGYDGPNVETALSLAQTAVDELNPFVVEGLNDGRYTAEGAFATALSYAAEQVTGDDEEEAQGCACGGSCGAQEPSDPQDDLYSLFEVIPIGPEGN